MNTQSSPNQDVCVSFFHALYDMQPSPNTAGTFSKLNVFNFSLVSGVVDNESAFV